MTTNHTPTPFSFAMTDFHPLYVAALEADEALKRELIRVYGPAKAGDARYKLRHAFNDPALNSALAAKLGADELWRQAMGILSESVVPKRGQS